MLNIRDSKMCKMPSLLSKISLPIEDSNIKQITACSFGSAKLEHIKWSVQRKEKSTLIRVVRGWKPEEKYRGEDTWTMIWRICIYRNFPCRKCRECHLRKRDQHLYKTKFLFWKLQGMYLRGVKKIFGWRHRQNSCP